MEIFAEIGGYEGRYMVSDKGNIMSLERKVNRGGHTLTIPTKILNRNKDGGGYYSVQLCKDGEVKRIHIHRLVASTFIPNPNNLPCVNHKDENKENNCASNLEWCSYEYNNNYRNHNNRLSEAKMNNKGKKVIQLDDKGDVIAEYESTREVQRMLGIPHENISACCRGKQKTAFGFVWKYKGEE